jgi:ABC-type transport system involved in multi-copper enzyme maturation permease subunit
MIALWKKEVMVYFSSMTGYLVAGVFLLMTGLFLWIIPGDTNIPFGGYASLDSLFWMAPWLYLFLVPAVTMRLLSEEQKSGTIELLLTKPMTDWHIIGGKYLAGITLVFVTLVPTLIYFVSIHYLAQPVGNIDHGRHMGFLHRIVIAGCGLYLHWAFYLLGYRQSNSGLCVGGGYLLPLLLWISGGGRAPLSEAGQWLFSVSGHRRALPIDQQRAWSIRAIWSIMAG